MLFSNEEHSGCAAPESLPVAFPMRGPPYSIRRLVGLLRRTGLGRTGGYIVVLAALFRDRFGISKHAPDFLPRAFIFLHKRGRGEEGLRRGRRRHVASLHVTRVMHTEHHAVYAVFTRAFEQLEPLFR